MSMIKRILNTVRRLTGREKCSPLDAYLPSDREIVLVDVGAHAGGFTEGIAKKWKISAAILVEPLPAQVAGLKELFCARPEFRIVHAAAGAAMGETVLHQYGFAETSSILPIKQGISELQGFDTRSAGTVRCPMRTLDDLTDDLPSIDLLKIDVQGAEHLVLAGAVSALAKSALVWTEVWFKPLYEGSSVFHEIYAVLNGAGFRLVDLAPGFRAVDGELVQADALFQKR